MDENDLPLTLEQAVKACSAVWEVRSKHGVEDSPEGHIRALLTAVVATGALHDPSVQPIKGLTAEEVEEGHRSMLEHLVPLVPREKLEVFRLRLLQMVEQEKWHD